MIPILCYHRIGGPPELGVTRVSRAVFERQMTALARDGWRTVGLEEFARHVRARHGVPLHGREFLLTFDDGYASLADHAYPILEHLGFTATTFLITDFVGAQNTWDARYTWDRLAHLSWDAIERWRDRGFAFGSHGATHRRLTWLSDDALTGDLRRSRAVLRDRLGDNAGAAVAYPFGAADARVRRCAEDAGYRLGFSSVRGSGSAFDLPRMPVYVWDAGAMPLGLRDDGWGTTGRRVASAVTRFAVGTSLLNVLRGLRHT